MREPAECRQDGGPAARCPRGRDPEGAYAGLAGSRAAPRRALQGSPMAGLLTWGPCPPSHGGKARAAHGREQGHRKLWDGRRLQMLSDFRSARLISLRADGTWANPFSVGAPGPPSCAVPPAEFLTWGRFAHVSDLPQPFSASTRVLHLLWLPKARRWDGALGWHNTSLSPRLAALCPVGTAALLSGLRDRQGVSASASTGG